MAPRTIGSFSPIAVFADHPIPAAARQAPPVRPLHAPSMRSCPTRSGYIRRTADRRVAGRQGLWGCDQNGGRAAAVYGITQTIHDTPKRSATMPKRGEKN